MIQLDGSLTVVLVVDIFLLLLIGIGPKIALVPFLAVTADMTPPTKRRVLRRMLLTAAVVAMVLLVLGSALTRLLHFSPGALSVASGIVLLIVAINMVLGIPESDGDPHGVKGRDPMQVAVVPLAVPYLLNPAGIVILVTVSAEADWLVVGATVVLLAFVLALDLVLFRWASRAGRQLDPSRLLVVEKVFGFLLAALAVQLALYGLAGLGVIHLIPGH